MILGLFSLSSYTIMHVIISLVSPALYFTPTGVVCPYHACALFSLLCLSHSLHKTRFRYGSGSLYTTAASSLTLCHD